MKKKSKIYIAKEDTPKYPDNTIELSWDTIIAKRGNAMSKDEVLKQIRHSK